MYRKYKVNYDNSNRNSSIDQEMPLWKQIEYEYKQSLKQSSKIGKEVDSDLKTIRIFISSTFKDFYNEREILVKKVFPKIRRWCEGKGLFLVECDMRWGVPTDATSVEAVSYCLDEIEKGRQETNNNNFFIGLIGDRFGWIPSEENDLEELRKKYDWIENSSVTLMEIVHGFIRSKTDNGLLMLRSSESLANVPLNHLKYFQEEDETTKYNVEELKRFILTNFNHDDYIVNYKISFDSKTIDPISGKERLSFNGFEEFTEQVEQFLMAKISKFKTKFHISSKTEDKNDDMLHRSYLKSLDTTFKRNFYLESIKKMMDEVRNLSLINNPIYLITGEAGTGKSTLMGNLINYFNEKKMGNIFYHFCGTSNTSHSFKNIAERFGSFIQETYKITVQKSEDLSQELNFHELFNRNDIPETIIIIDALDEISDKEWEKNFPTFTSSKILLLISVLKEDEVGTVYFTLKNSERNIREIEIEPMTNEQLSYIVSTYLNNFGKRLDSFQMDSLLNINSSKNPLWLISACEELRIHGDYSTLKKVILSLPTNILDINTMIIKRLMNQDSTDLIRCFLTVLVISKAGVWESIVRDLLSYIMEYQDPVSHSTWLDIIRQLKGFLQIQSVPLPLIKFRHRVTKQSVEKELELNEISQIPFHIKMADFFESNSNDDNNLFLGDFVYHLLKCDGRDRMISFMRSKKSWELFKQSFVRSKVMMSMRCINPINNIPQQQPSYLVLCVLCANKSGQLSIYNGNRNSCFYCGNLATGNERLLTCVNHKYLNPQIKSCALCGQMVGGGQENYVKICQMCKSVGLPGKCGVLVKEKDIFFRQQLGFSKAVNRIENLI